MPGTWTLATPWHPCMLLATRHKSGPLPCRQGSRRICAGFYACTKRKAGDMLARGSLMLGIIIAARLVTPCDAKAQGEPVASELRGPREIFVQMPTVEEKQRECRQVATRYVQAKHGDGFRLPDEQWRFGWDFDPESPIPCVAGVELVTFRVSVPWPSADEWTSPEVRQSFSVVDPRTGRELAYAQRHAWAPLESGGPEFRSVEEVQGWFLGPATAKPWEIVTASHWLFQTESREWIAEIVFGLRDRMVDRPEPTR